MSHYSHLSIMERESIWQKRNEGKSLREIGKELKRNVSTVSRELNRNRMKEYSPHQAQQAYHRRRKKCKRNYVLKPGPVRETVIRLLSTEQWSPEQIANRMKMEEKESVSYNTIYRALKKGLLEPAGTKKTRHGKYPLQKNLRRRAKQKGTKKQGRTHISHKVSSSGQKKRTSEARSVIGKEIHCTPDITKAM